MNLLLHSQVQGIGLAATVYVRERDRQKVSEKQERISVWWCVSVDMSNID